MFAGKVWPFSLKGTLAVRFQRQHQANAKRSQTDEVAKAGLNFLIIIWGNFTSSGEQTQGDDTSHICGANGLRLVSFKCYFCLSQSQSGW